MPKLSTTVPGGAALFQRVYTRLNCEGRPPRFHVDFYPYSSLTLTIRRREENVFVRFFSDLLQRAPLPVLEAAAALLLARVYRRRASRQLTAPYLDYARSHKTRARINRMRGTRVRATTQPQGRHFDLEKLFDDLNAKYFEGKLARPNIGWSSCLAPPIRLSRPRP